MNLYRIPTKGKDQYLLRKQSLEAFPCKQLFLNLTWWRQIDCSLVKSLEKLERYFGFSNNLVLIKNRLFGRYLSRILNNLVVKQLNCWYSKNGQLLLTLKYLDNAYQLCYVITDFEQLNTQWELALYCLFFTFYIFLCLYIE